MATDILVADLSINATDCFEEENSFRSVDENSDAYADDKFSLLCHSSYPSKTFEAPNLDVSFQSIESNGIHGDRALQLLPLQKYHARSLPRRSQTNGRFRDESTGREGISHGNSFDEEYLDGKAIKDLLNGTPRTVSHDIPSLEFIYENLSRFPITKSSQVLLEEYHTHKQTFRTTNRSDNSTLLTNDNKSEPEDQRKHLALLKGRLRSKIRAECRASLPIVIEDTLQILYCDSHMCVVNKPSGVLSVPGHKRNPSLADLVYDTIQPSSGYENDGSIDNIDQSVVHRLDMATSGILVYALSKEALQKLHVTFRDRKVKKIYQALVEGHLDVGGAIEGEIDVALERDPTNPPYMRIAKPREEVPTESSNDDDGSQPPKVHKFWREAPKPSKTTWSVLGYERDGEGNPLTRVALTPHTGRTHQLRVHTSSVLGTPIVGDDIYGSGNHPPNANLCLHAHRLCLHHPITGAPMVFEADPPF
jgi:tRNA pseudouridine32 synthase/23S rRNA pseudouridine746 synthase